jgi:hypothetical protein
MYVPLFVSRGGGGGLTVPTIALENVFLSSSKPPLYPKDGIKKIERVSIRYGGKSWLRHHFQAQLTYQARTVEGCP